MQQVQREAELLPFFPPKERRIAARALLSHLAAALDQSPSPRGQVQRDAVQPFTAGERGRVNPGRRMGPPHDFPLRVIRTPLSLEWVGFEHSERFEACE